MPAVSFAGLFSAAYHRAYRWDLWGAAYIIGGGCSDDSFMDFREWLISMGQRVYDAALSRPDALAEVVRAPGIESCFFEGFGYVAQEVLEAKGVSDQQLPLDAHPSDPAGERWQEAELPVLFPALWHAFGSR